MSEDPAAKAALEDEGDEQDEEDPDTVGPPSQASTTTGNGTRYEQNPATDSNSPDIGTHLDRYTVLERIGSGGMGEVYAAFDGKLDRKVALKLLRHRSEEYQARLVREAQAMARLLHPNVVAVFDTGVVGKRFYLAMEFVRGVTLRAWQRSQERKIAEVLRVYGEAGRGLAAAHAAGLVHRDFKPDNVLIADDGRVKVTDFGIARSIGDDSAPAARDLAKKLGSNPPPPPVREKPAPATSATFSTSGSLDNPMTAEGALLGTPGYMAPEQFLCEPVDERTDQFAFCVSLYEALYHVKPFVRLGKASLEQIAQATVEGKITDPPKGTAVPAHVRRVLLRGLRSRREDRYPSMGELLDDLARDPAKERRRVVAAIAAAALVAAGGAAVAVSSARHRAALAATCEAEGNAIDARWGPDERARVGEAMLVGGGAGNRERAERAVSALDGFAKAWKEEQASSCTATRLAKTQTEEVHDKRSACLLGARQKFEAVVETLQTRDADVNRHALDITTRALLPPRLCGVREVERSSAPLPSDPHRRAQAEEARSLTTRAQIRGLSGRYKEAVELAEKAAKLAHEADSPGNEAVALYEVASNLGQTFDVAGAIARAHEALDVAEQVGDDQTAADAAQWIAYSLSNQLGKHDEAAPWLSLAWAKSRRLGKDDYLEIKLHRVASILEYGRGNFAAAAEETEKSAKLGRALYGDRSMDVCFALGNESVFLLSAKNYAGALSTAKEGIVCQEAATGADNPDMAFPYDNLGEASYSVGKLHEALAAWKHGVDVRRELGSGDALSLSMLASAALAEAGLGRLREARDDARIVLFGVEGRGGDLRSLDSLSRGAHMTALLVLGVTSLAEANAKDAKTQCARSVTEHDEAKALSPDAALRLDPLACLAEAELALGEVAASRVHLERSIALPKRTFPGDLARARFALARALELPPEPNVARARDQALLAREELALASQHNPSLAPFAATVARWLAEHPSR